MKSENVSVFENREGERLYSDSCDSLNAAAARGDLQLHALAHTPYPGYQLPDTTLPEIKTIGYWDAKHRQNWGLPWHCNEGIELTFLETGELEFETEDGSCTLAPSSLTITRPWQPHRVGNPEIGSGRLHWIILDVGIRQPHQEWIWPDWMVFSESELAELTRFMRGNEAPVWQTTPEIEHCFKRIGEAIVARQQEVRASRLSIYINELFLCLLELFRAEKVEITQELTCADRSVKRFLAELKNNLEEPWTVNAMAEASGLGVTRFVHYCRQLTNQTPMQYLNTLRLEFAAELLRSEPRTGITGIAFRCGFSSSQYFATAFKKLYGTTPRAFRKSAAR